MRPYEVMIVFDISQEEEKIQAWLSRINDSIKRVGGEPLKVDRWGRRQLAYEVDHKREGNYVLVTADAPAGSLSELDRMLRIADEVIRHKVVRIPDKAPGAVANRTE